MEGIGAVRDPGQADNTPTRDIVADLDGDPRQVRIARLQVPSVIDGHGAVANHDPGERDHPSIGGYDLGAGINTEIKPPMAIEAADRREMANNHAINWLVHRVTTGTDRPEQVSGQNERDGEAHTKLLSPPPPRRQRIRSPDRLEAPRSLNAPEAKGQWPAALPY